MVGHLLPPASGSWPQSKSREPAPSLQSALGYRRGVQAQVQAGPLATPLRPRTEKSGRRCRGRRWLSLARTACSRGESGSLHAVGSALVLSGAGAVRGRANRGDRQRQRSSRGSRSPHTSAGTVRPGSRSIETRMSWACPCARALAYPSARMAGIGAWPAASAWRSSRAVAR